MGRATAESIKVAVRVRPFRIHAAVDAADGGGEEEESRSSIQVNDGRPPHAVVRTDGPLTTVLTNPPKVFEFDLAYTSIDENSDSMASQEEVYRDLGETMVLNALDGYNGSLFAYGQTGSGKSYTVMGMRSQPGLIPRCIDQIFAKKAEIELDSGKELRIWASYLEIYNEHLHDLLAVERPDPHDPARGLKIVEHPKVGVWVPSLTEAACQNANACERLLEYGMKRRVIGATCMNSVSSRSHVVFIIKVLLMVGTAPRNGEADTRRVLSAKINLTDLAGSERQAKTKTEGVRMREGCSINQSLSTLALVIKDITENTSKQQKGKVANNNVAFRASKLTFLLKNSLVGNSKTYMIATVAPEAEHMQETISTLRFAQSVKKIKTTAVQNHDKKDDLINQLQEEIRRLKEDASKSDLMNLSALSRLDDERSNDTVRVQELEQVVENLKMDYEAQLSQAKDLEEQSRMQRKRSVMRFGLDGNSITDQFGVDKATPYFLNMSDDPMVAGCLIYYLSEEGAQEPNIIGASSECKIKLRGIGISERLCRVLNRGNTELKIEKLSSTGRVCVNGRLVHKGEAVRLQHGDKVYIGRAYALKLVVPQKAPSDGGEELGLSLAGLDDEWSAIEDSKSWGGLQEYLSQILATMPAQQAQHLFSEIRKACKLCDEANEITAECRATERLTFEVDLTSSVPFSVVIRVLQADDPHSPRAMVSTSDMESDGYITRYYWSVAKMEERLERMRDYHRDMMLNGFSNLETLLDPWHEPHPGAIAQKLKELEMMLMRERQIEQQYKVISTGKIYFLWKTGAQQEAERAVLRSWCTWAKAMKRSREKTANSTKPAGMKTGLASARRSSSQNQSHTPTAGTAAGPPAKAVPKQPPERRPSLKRRTSPTVSRQASGCTPGGASSSQEVRIATAAGHDDESSIGGISIVAPANSSNTTPVSARGLRNSKELRGEPLAHAMEPYAMASSVMGVSGCHQPSTSGTSTGDILNLPKEVSRDQVKISPDELQNVLAAAPELSVLGQLRQHVTSLMVENDSLKKQVANMWQLVDHEKSRPVSPMSSRPHVQMGTSATMESTQMSRSMFAIPTGALGPASYSSSSCALGSATSLPAPAGSYQRMSFGSYQPPAQQHQHPHASGSGHSPRGSHGGHAAVGQQQAHAQQAHAQHPPRTRSHSPASARSAVKMVSAPVVRSPATTTEVAIASLTSPRPQGLLVKTVSPARVAVGSVGWGHSQSYTGSVHVAPAGVARRSHA